MITHFRDPCIHCGKGMQDFVSGGCPGDTSKAIPIAYRSLGVRWDNYEHFLVRMSTNEVIERWHHVSDAAPYRHFDMRNGIQPPLRQDQRIVIPLRPLTETDPVAQGN